MYSLMYINVECDHRRNYKNRTFGNHDHHKNQITTTYDQ